MKGAKHVCGFDQVLLDSPSHSDSVLTLTSSIPLPLLGTFNNCSSLPAALSVCLVLFCSQSNSVQPFFDHTRMLLSLFFYF